MTEQEKMKKGYLWADDEENMALQARAKGFVREFNSLPPEDMEGRAALLKEIFGNVGEHVWIVPHLRLQWENMYRSEKAPMRI